VVHARTLSGVRARLQSVALALREGADGVEDAVQLAGSSSSCKLQLLRLSCTPQRAANQDAEHAAKDTAQGATGKRSEHGLHAAV